MKLTGRQVFVAGSNAFGTFCCDKILFDKLTTNEINTRNENNIKCLMESGCDLIINETLG